MTKCIIHNLTFILYCRTMVKLYFYATKDDYEDILNDEVIVKPDEKGIYLCTFNPTDYMKNDKHLEEFDEDDRALNNHIRLRGRRPRTNGGRLARLDHYFKFDIPFFDIHLCEGGSGTLPSGTKIKSYRYVGDIHFDRYDWSSGRCEDAEEESESSDEDLTWDHPVVEAEVLTSARENLEEECGADRRGLIQELKMGSAECPFVKSGMSFKEVVEFVAMVDCTISAVELKYLF